MPRDGGAAPGPGKQPCNTQWWHSRCGWRAGSTRTPKLQPEPVTPERDELLVSSLRAGGLQGAARAQGSRPQSSAAIASFYFCQLEQCLIPLYGICAYISQST